MTISYIITNYLIKIEQIHDQLVAVGEKVEDKENSRVFVLRKTFPPRNDCIQKETWMGSKETK